METSVADTKPPAAANAGERRWGQEGFPRTDAALPERRVARTFSGDTSGRTVLAAEEKKEEREQQSEGEEQQLRK